MTWLSKACLYVLLIVLAVRPLTGETFHSSSVMSGAALRGVADPSTASTLTLDLVLVLASFGILLNTPARGGTRRGWTLPLGAVVLLGSLAFSCIFAGEKRPAINAAIDLAATGVMAMAIARCGQAVEVRRLVLATLLASTAVTAGKCVTQWAFEFGETEQAYREQREAIWQSQGVPLDSPRVELFERRLAAREASGYFAHSNVAGGFLQSGAILALGLALAAWRHRSRGESDMGPAILILVAAAAGVGVYLTHSTGAGVALLTGCALFFVGTIFLPRVMTHRRRLLIVGWIVAAGGVLGVVGWGIARGSLPHPSLDFRWQYWQVAAEMFADRPLTGVGPENFGNHYVAYKPITAPEEVSNPHNYLVQAATEYGAFGLAAAVLLLVALSRRLLPEPRTDEAGPAEPRPSSYGDLAAWTLTVTAGMLIVRSAMMADNDPRLLLWEFLFNGPLWLAAFGLVLLATRRAFDQDAIVRLGIGCGVFAFLLQDLINFALFVPGARTPFMAAVGLLMAGSTTALSAETPSKQRWLAPVPLGVLVIALVCVINLPFVVGSESSLRRARALAIRDATGAYFDEVHRRYQIATDRDGLDATPPTEHTRWLLTAAAAQPSAAKAVPILEIASTSVEKAIARNPQDSGLRLLQSRVYLMQFTARDDVADLRKAEAAVRAAIERYPQRPDHFLSLANCLALFNTCAKDREAVAALTRALDLDASRPAWEEIRRFSRDRLDRIEGERSRITGQIQQRCPDE